MTKPEIFLTRSEVAKMLRTSEDTISTYIKDGKLKAIKIGRRLLIPTSAISKLTETV